MPTPKFKAPKLKGKNRLIMFGGAFFLIALIAVSAFLSMNATAFAKDPIWNSGSDKTDLVDNIIPNGNGNGGSPTPTMLPDGTYPTPTPSESSYINPQYPTATPWNGPNPTPLPTWNPIGPTAPPTAEPTAVPTAVPTAPPTAPPTNAPSQQQQQQAVRIKVWQTLYITNVDGPNYWVSPKQPFSLASIFGSQSGTGSDFTLVKTMQNNIYMNIPASSISPYQVRMWSFHCKETIELQKLDGSIITSVVNNKDVDATGTNPQLSSNAWITGASVPSADLQKILKAQFTTLGQCNFIIKLSDISLTITLTNGDVHTLRPDAAASPDNTLTWRISVIK